MLYIISKDTDKEERTWTSETTWNIGEKIKNSPKVLEKVVYIQADGDELEYIREISPIQAAKKRIVYFYGEFARQILINL